MKVSADIRFAVVPEWILHADISAQAVRLYGVLDRYANKEGEAHPGYTAIGKRMHSAPSTIKRAAAELEAIGAITISQTMDPVSKTWATNAYQLHPAPPDTSTARGIPPSAARGIPPSAARGRGPLPPVDPPSTAGGPQMKAMNEPTAESTALVQTSLFDAFWKIYPKHKARPDAQAAFERALRGGRIKGVQRPPVAAEVILEGARRVRDDPNLPDPRSPDWAYVPHPASWLNQARWEDEEGMPARGKDHGITTRELQERTAETLRTGDESGAQSMQEYYDAIGRMGDGEDQEGAGRGIAHDVARELRPADDRA